MLALVLVYVLGTKVAASQADDLLDSAVMQMRADIDKGPDDVINLVGASIVRRFNKPELITNDDIMAYSRMLPLDEICVVDSNSVFLCSTDPSVPIGDKFNLSSKRRLLDYTPLMHGLPNLVEPAFRISADDPNACRKYGATAWSENRGFVQIGLDIKRLGTDLEFYYRTVACDWSIGVCGYYLVADPKTGKIVTATNSGLRGKLLRDDDVAPNIPEKCPGDEESRLYLIGGSKCYVRDFVHCGLRVIAVVPEAEVSAYRTVAVSIASVVMFVLMSAFGVMISAIVKRNAQMRKFFEAERAQAERELAMAKSIQMNALPAVFPPYPDIADRIDICAAMHTAKEVGGDFYDFYYVGANKLAILIADVSGKGVPAAMFMMRAKTTLQAVLRGGGEIGEAVSDANMRISDGNDATMFVTAWIGVIDLCTGEVEYVNAGHNPPILHRRGGHNEWLRSLSGPPLAVVSNVKYKKHNLVLNPGDGIFLYTDGVTEAVNVSCELFGESRLFEALSNPKDVKFSIRSAQRLCEDIAMRVKDFEGAAEQADDITMLAFNLNGEERTFVCTSEGILESQKFLEGYCDNPKASVIHDEIVSNIVRCSGAQIFAMKIVNCGDGFVITYTDSGKPFDPTTEIADPDLTASVESRKIGGLGMYMVKKMSKSVTYRRKGDYNELSVSI